MSRDKETENSAVPARSEPLPLEFPGVHYINEEEVEAAVRLLRSRSLFRYYGVDLQKEVESFEDEFSRFVGTRNAVAVASGTSALSVAMSAFGVGPGQEVIVPAYMWVSVAAAVVHQGAIPVLADIDDTFCLDPAAAEAAITPKTTGIVLVHMSGAPGDIQKIRSVARKHGLFLLEDCAQCAGGSVGGKRAGSFGDIGIFSFQMNKNMTVGEGGCIVTSDPHLYRRIFAGHDLGYPRNAEGRLIFDEPGLCLWGRGVRLDELRASVLRVQLRKLPAIIAAMHHSKYRIREVLGEYEQVQLRRIIDPAGDTGCFLITTYPDRDTTCRVNKRLHAEGIRTYPQGLSNILMTDWGLHLYYNITSLVQHASVDPAGFPWKLAENEGMVRDYGKGTCPVADSLFERSILIPVPSCLTSRDEDEIVLAFQRALA